MVEEIMRKFPLSFESEVINTLMKWICHAVADVVLKEVSRNVFPEIYLIFFDNNNNWFSF